MLLNSFSLLSKFYLLMIGVMFVVFSAVFSLYVHAEKSIDIANDERLISHYLFDELEQSSNDLTHMVRAYVVTKDLKYKYKFQEIIDIREGLIPRPHHTNIHIELSSLKAKLKIDYDKAESIAKIISKSGLGRDAIAKLLQAKNNSDELVIIERKAMAILESELVAGIQQQKAIALVYGHEYDEGKARVMLPILEAQLLIENRSKIKVEEAIIMANIMRYVFVFSGAILFFLLFRAYLQWRKLYYELETAKREAEAAEDAKGSFMANMSHEIRTPLNGIVGFVNLLSKSPLSSEQNRYIGIIQSSIESLMVIVNDILDFSKIAEGKKEVELLEINPKAEFEKAFILFEPTAKDKQIMYEIQLDSMLSPCIKLDLFILKQVMLNLISNAIKFTPVKGTVTISVAVVEDTLTRQTLMFDVEDTGPGISEMAMADIFDKFTQADVSTTRMHGGTGLGLSIAYSLVEMMGGMLKVRSEVGKGSSFTFKLTVDKCLEKIKAAPLTEEIAINEVFIAPELHVLVAEDQDINQMLIDEYLKRYKIQADFANNGEEAVALAHKNDYDLILMDINMPVMDGIEATGLIKKTYPDLLIVALTANALEGDYEKFMEAGMNEYLTKPINVPALEAILRHVKGLKD